MKRKCFIASVTLVLFLSLASCFVSTASPHPYGVWQSDDPELIIDVIPGQSGRYPGEYVVDGKTIETITNFFVGGDEFTIYDINAIEEDGLNADNPYFSGTYKIKDDGKLYYKLKKYWRELTGYDTIVFEKIKDYEVPEE